MQDRLRKILNTRIFQNPANDRPWDMNVSQRELMVASRALLAKPGVLTGSLLNLLAAPLVLGQQSFRCNACTVLQPLVCAQDGLSLPAFQALSEVPAGSWDTQVVNTATLNA